MVSNMKKFIKLISLITLVCTIVCALGACNIVSQPTTGTNTETEWVDYADQLKLDKDSTETLKWEVTVKMFIDGDTTHFYVNNSGNINGISQAPGIEGVLKARYLGINTPESTGKIEPWGKKASNFTKSKLETAESIIIESDDGNWNVDSTGERFLVWVWYKPEGASDYRNLNLEFFKRVLLGHRVTTITFMLMHAVTLFRRLWRTSFTFTIRPFRIPISTTAQLSS